jgi:hypothetical protein
MYCYEGVFQEQTFWLLPVTILKSKVYKSIILPDVKSVLVLLCRVDVVEVSNVLEVHIFGV